MKPQVNSSIENLSGFILDSMDDYFSDHGIQFNREAFMNDASPFLRFISETAHFSGTGILG